jgi:hypothetical protein
MASAIIQAATIQARHDRSIEKHPLWTSVIQQLANVPRTIAPERWDSVKSSWEHLSLYVSDEPKSLMAGVSQDRRRIVVHSGYVDALWCFAVAGFALQTVYERELATTDLTRKPLVLEINDSHVAIAFDYLTAGLKLLVERASVDWGALPGLHDELRKGATQLALCAWGHTIYHEFAHIACRHQWISEKSSEDDLGTSREQESEADNFALNHCFLGLDDGSDKAKTELGFRAWGVAISMLILVAREALQISAIQGVERAKTDDVLARTHPLPYTRMDRFLGHSSIASIPEVECTAYAAVCIPLYALCVANGVTLSQEGCSVRDWKALYNNLAEQLFAQLERVPRRKRN